MKRLDRAWVIKAKRADSLQTKVTRKDKKLKRKRKEDKLKNISGNLVCGDEEFKKRCHFWLKSCFSQNASFCISRTFSQKLLHIGKRNIYNMFN